MSKRVLDVGQCALDHGNIRHLLAQHFDVQVEQAHSTPEALGRLKQEAYDLVLVNRLLDRDHSPGLDLVQQLKADEQLAAIPVMLVSNYPASQQEAVAAGAAPGFGKSEYRDPATVEKLRAVLGEA